jgi:acetyl-CoA carboxylase biotin carboxyl carrier protein
MIDLRYVKKLVEMLDESSVDSIEISSDKGMKIRISKTASQRGVVQMAAPVQPMMPAEPRLSPAAGTPQPAAAVEPVVVEAPKANTLDIKSPMVGTFYGAPEPGAKPYVSVGDKISKGQTLCIIEAMKIMNEIESEYAGTVRAISATDAHPVEYGQVLFKIEPNG